MAVDYFINIDGVKGEATNAKYKDQIVVESFSWGETRVGSGAGKTQAQSFVFVQKTNKATPKLFLACATGEHFKKAVFVCVDKFEFLKITLDDCIVRSFQIAGDGDRPLEEISLNFAKLSMEYKPKKPDGTPDAPIKAGYDFAGGKKI